VRDNFLKSVVNKNAYIEFEEKLQSLEEELVDFEYKKVSILGIMKIPIFSFYKERYMRENKYSWNLKDS